MGPRVEEKISCPVTYWTKLFSASQCCRNASLQTPSNASKLLCFCCDGVTYVPVELRLLTDALHIPQMGETTECWWQRNEGLVEGPVQMPLCPVQIQYGLGSEPRPLKWEAGHYMFIKLCVKSGHLRNSTGRLNGNCRNSSSSRSLVHKQASIQKQFHKWGEWTVFAARKFRRNFYVLKRDLRVYSIAFSFLFIVFNYN